MNALVKIPTVAEFLPPLAKKFPSKVKNLRVGLGVDHDGEESIFFTVTLKRKPAGKMYRWKDVSDIDTYIRQQVSGRDLSQFPYIEYESQGGGASRQ